MTDHERGSPTQNRKPFRLREPRTPEEAARKKAAEDRWRRQNRAAIEDNNRRIEAEGLWSDGLRLF